MAKKGKKKPPSDMQCPLAIKRDPFGMRYYPTEPPALLLIMMCLVGLGNASLGPATESFSNASVELP